MTIDVRVRDEGRDPSRVARPLLIRLASVGLIALAACGGGDGGRAGGGGAGERNVGERQAEVAERGGDVMPFDLDATTHRFDPVDEGLVQTVTADDPGDEEQVALVRGHLESEAVRFAAGDYADPASIHGADMPGLAELEAGAERIAVTYEAIEAGGRIDYVTADPDLVDALDRWAEAQTMDHGSHAEAPG